MITIDINCDVGEGIENEYLLMPYISSCNIACGGHFGDENTIDKTIELALRNNVKIGAHPSFPDKKNFGRKVLDISDIKLQQSIEQQLILFKSRAEKQKAIIHHVKPHGALYNLIAKNEIVAKIVVNAIQNILKDVKLYVPYNSVIEKVAKENKVEIVYEAFADRNYNEDLTLVSRNNLNAVISDSKEVYKHLLFIIKNKEVLTIQNSKKRIKADTFCIHGDNEKALDILREITKLLKVDNIQIA